MHEKQWGPITYQSGLWLACIYKIPWVTSGKENLNFKEKSFPELLWTISQHAIALRNQFKVLFIKLVSISDFYLKKIQIIGEINAKGPFTQLLVIAIALAGIAKNGGYSTHSLAKFSAHFYIANAIAIDKSSAWMELKTQVLAIIDLCRLVNDPQNTQLSQSKLFIHPPAFPWRGPIRRGAQTYFGQNARKTA